MKWALAAVGSDCRPCTFPSRKAGWSAQGNHVRLTSACTGAVLVTYRIKVPSMAFFRPAVALLSVQQHAQTPARFLCKQNESPTTTRSPSREFLLLYA